MQSKDFLDVKDVAEILGLTERTVRDLFKSGEIKARKVAGKYIITRSLLKDFVEK